MRNDGEERYEVSTDRPIRRDDRHLEDEVLDARELDDTTVSERHVAAWAETVDRVARGGLGALDEDERVRFERALAEDATLREALSDARRAREIFAGIDATAELSADRSRELRARILAEADADAGVLRAEPAAPISRRVARHAPRRTSAPQGPVSGRRGRRTQWLVHAAAAAAAVVLLAVVLPSQLRTSRDAGSVVIDGRTYTEAEIRAATEQMETAMAMLSHAVDRTSSIVRSEMTQELREHVTDPLQEGLGLTVRSIPYLRPVPREDGHSGLLSPPRGVRPRGLDMNGSLERT